MQYQTTPRFGPQYTPPVIKFFLWAILIGSVGIAFAQQLFGFPIGFLGLSLWGVKKFFLWQFITYPFVVAGGLSFGLVLYVLFELYIVWVIGTQLVERVGVKPFVRLFFLSAILAGAASLLVPIGLFLTGATPVLYALLVAWMMYYPDMQMLLFLIFPLKTRWLVIGLLAISVLMDLGAGNWPTLVANLVGAATGYIYALSAWNLQGPFQFMRPFDDFVARLGTRIRRWLHR